MALTARQWATRYEDECRRLEGEVARAKAAAERSIEAINQAGGESRAAPEMLNRRDGCVADYTRVKDELRRNEGAARHMRGEAAVDDEYERKANETTPGARPLPPGQLPGDPGTREARIGGSPTQPREVPAGLWTREDGRPAAVERGQRMADHPVAAELIARDHAGRHVTESYSGIGQLLRTMSTTGASALVPTLWSSRIIDRARNAAQVINAGAETIVMDSKQLNIGRLTGSATAAWVAEAGTRTPADETFDTVSLVAKTLYAFTQCTIEFLQDAPNADSLIEEDIGKQMGLAIDMAALFGGASGTDFTAAAAMTPGAQASPPGPLGILGNLAANYTAGILGAGANGTAITPATPWNELLTTYFLPLRNNEQVTAILMNAAMQQKYAQTYDTLGQPLRLPPVLQSVPWLITNQIPSFTQGTMTNVATDIFAGDFRQVLIGQRLDMTTQILSERYAEAGSVGILTTFRGDIQLARPKSMAVYRYIGGS